MSGFLSGRTSLTTVNTSDIAANAIDGTLTKDALIGDYSDVTVTAADLIIYGDATDSNNTKRDTVQGILDLAGGGAWNIIGTSVASSSASLTITGLDSTYDTYAIGLSDLIPATDGVVPWMRVGDSSGIDSGSTDYEHFTNALYGGNAAPTNTTSGGDTKIILWSTADGDTVGSASGEGFGGGILYLHQPGDSSQWSQITGTTCGIGAGSGQSVIGNAVMGTRRAVITLDRVQFLFSSGNITSGRMTIWGIAHA